jgi:ESS family glutamate:Na+ symporter
LVIAGLKSFSITLIDKNLMQIITYHTMGLGFISVALKSTGKEKVRERTMEVIDTGAIVVSTYIIQGIVGLLITKGLAMSIMPGLFQGSGLLLPMGFGQGSGQALNIGIIFEGMGFENGASFGLADAAIGFLCACIVGVIYMNILKRKGKLHFVELGDDTGLISSQEISAPDEIPLTESVDKFTIQISLVIFAYFLTYLLMLGLEDLSYKMGRFGINTVNPLIWGFNFIFGTIVAGIMKLVFRFLRKTNLMTREYPNNFLLNRISGFMFDLMIITGIAAIEINDLKALFIPLALISVAGGIVTFIYLRYICKKSYPTYSDEAFFSLFGMLTGTASTGMILLREIDPKYETPAAYNLVFHAIPAIAFGFPLMFLIPLAAKGTPQAIFTLAFIAIMFVAFNIFILRKFIFRHRRTIK